MLNEILIADAAVYSNLRDAEDMAKTLRCLGLRAEVEHHGPNVNLVRVLDKRGYTTLTDTMVAELQPQLTTPSFWVPGMVMCLVALDDSGLWAERVPDMEEVDRWQRGRSTRVQYRMSIASWRAIIVEVVDRISSWAGAECTREGWCHTKSEQGAGRTWLKRVRDTFPNAELRQLAERSLI